MSEVWQSSVKRWDEHGEHGHIALRQAWGSGNLSWKLHPDQVTVYQQIKASFAKAPSSPERMFFLDIGRQWGKDYLTSLICVEALYQAMARREQARLPFGAPTRDEVKELLVPTLEDLFIDCPPELRPQEIQDSSFTKSAKELTLPGGQRLVLVGCDLHPDRLRGPASLGFALTECGFMDLDEVLKSILLPQLQTKPDGFGLCNSSPPKTPAHSWSREWLPKAKMEGQYAHRTIDDNPRMSDAQRKGIIKALGGRESNQVRRELYAEHIAEEESLIVPEFQQVKGEPDGSGGYLGGIITDEYTRPKYFDAYVALDPGMVHLCAALFAYWDFENDQLVIEDEWCAPRANTNKVASALEGKERELWGETARWGGKELKPNPMLRVSDTDLRLIADLSTIHGLQFVATAKDDRDAAINSLRVRVQNRKYIIHPRCTGLVAHLDHGVWNKHRTKFAESGDFGHFDYVAALVYLDRNIQRHRNPFPPEGWDADPRTHQIEHWVGIRQPSSAGKAIKQVFGGRRTGSGRQRR